MGTGKSISSWIKSKQPDADVTNWSHQRVILCSLPHQRVILSDESSSAVCPIIELSSAVCPSNELSSATSYPLQSVLSTSYPLQSALTSSYPLQSALSSSYPLQSSTATSYPMLPAPPTSGKLLYIHRMMQAVHASIGSHVIQESQVPTLYIHTFVASHFGYTCCWTTGGIKVSISLRQPRAFRAAFLTQNQQR